MFYFFNQIKTLIDFDKVVTIEKILLEKDPKFLMILTNYVDKVKITLTFAI